MKPPKALPGRPADTNTRTALAIRTGAALSVEKARDMLARCVDLDEAHGIRDTARAAETYFRSVKAGREAQNAATEIVARAERRMGELTAKMPKVAPEDKSRGRGKIGPSAGPISKTSTLKDLGVTKQEAHRWEKLASIPEKRFEAHVAEVKAKAEKLTTSGVLALAPSKAPTKKAPPRVPKGSVEATEFFLSRAVAAAEEPWNEDDALTDARDALTAMLDAWRGDSFRPLAMLLRIWVDKLDAREAKRHVGKVG
jgi:hypothetical protein